MSLVFTGFVPAAAQEACDFDRQSPSLENARRSFQTGAYQCAREELELLLAKNELSRRAKANSHALLGAVYYRLTEDPQMRRRLVREQFIMVFRTDRNWSEELQISDPDFLTIVTDARELVDWLYETSPELFTQPADSTGQQTDEPAGKSAPWYRRWWAIGSGVGLTILALSIFGGSDDNGNGGPTQPDSLPGFPPTPN